MSTPETTPSEASLVFAGSLSHELRAPLATIQGYAQLLRDALGEHARPDEREFLQAILASANHAMDLVAELLDFSRLAAGRLELHPAPVCLNALCDEIVHLRFPDAAQKGLALLGYEGPERLYAWADITRLRQVMVNLVTNAIKYTDRGVIGLELETAEDRVAIRVRDTGRGIAPEFIPRLFERYSREERIAETIQQGAGIGLALAIEYIHLMEGTIEVASTPGEGSVFTLWLPRADLHRY